MGRPAVSEVVKIRKAIIALCDDDFEDLVRDIGIIEEIRDDLKKGKLKGDPPEGQTPVKGFADPKEAEKAEKTA